MASLKPNLVKRIERLPKPTSASGALIPLFEAVSNAIHSAQSRFGPTVATQGQVNVTVTTNRKKLKVSATVEDNGVGLSPANWEAFTTTDTDNKITIGGKGVGRLMWLDCFQNTRVYSTFFDDGKLQRRSFRFVLDNEDQIQEEILEAYPQGVDSSFLVHFEGLRENAYFDKFPGRGNFIFQHLTSHFLPVFIGGRSPQITVTVGDEIQQYPSAIERIVHRKSEPLILDTEPYGQLKLTLMECDRVASADLKGQHFIHFIAHDRTVHSQAIDGKLGLGCFGEKGDRVFHAILTGSYLDSNVNQQRTDFTFEDAVIDRIINDVCYDHVADFLSAPLALLRGQQRGMIDEITNTYPSVRFGDIEELQGRVPSGELKMDAIYGHLARERFRRDEKQAERIRDVLTRLKDSKVDATMLKSSIGEATKAIEDAEQRSLTEYVVRRKVVLDFMDVLLEKTRDDAADSSFQREDVLHSFICPVRVNNAAGTTSRKVQPSSTHDLWILDERLTFAEYFSSDIEFSALADAFDSEERADVLIFDRVHGLRQTQDPSKVLLIEFKRPGRTSYPESENPFAQVERYVRQLKGGALSDVRGRPIQLDDRTVFNCYVVADMVGKIADWTYTWQPTADGRGRIHVPQGGFRGSIELITWDSLLTDARARNEAFFDRAGISGKSFFAPS